MNTKLLSNMIIACIEGKQNQDDATSRTVALLTENVLACFVSDEVKKMRNKPTLWQAQIVACLEELVNGDMDVVKLIEQIENPGNGHNRRHSRPIKIQGDNNHVVNVNGNWIINNAHTTDGGIHALPSVFQLVFGDKTSNDHATQPQTTILFVAANPNGYRLKLDRDIQSIQNSLKLANNREDFCLKALWGATPDSLIQAILEEKPQIVHFAGHSVHTGILLQDESGQEQFVTTQALANLFNSFKESIDCVVLNACFSQTHAQAIKAHIPNVIGMNNKIHDSAASAFCSGFYKGIFASESIGQAFEIGKNTVGLKGLPDEHVPVLLQ
jgi:hypothetical protein